MLELLETPLTVLHVVVCLFLVMIVLIQPGKSGGIGAALGGAGAQQVFGGRGAGSFLSRLTWASAGTFFVTSMTLAYLSSSTGDSLEARSGVVEAKDLPAAEQPAADSADDGEESQEKTGASDDKTGESESAGTEADESELDSEQKASEPAPPARADSTTDQEQPAPSPKSGATPATPEPNKPAVP